MHSPDITYIVSSYDRPRLLRRALYSIEVQSHESFEVIVTDNSRDPQITAEHKRIVAAMNDKRFKYLRTAGKTKVNDCFWAAEAAAKIAKGAWLCFPCDDTYLVREFGQRMLAEAYRSNLDFVYCDCVVGPLGTGDHNYRVWDVQIPGSTIKTTYIVKASKFPGFLSKPNSETCAGADVALANQMKARGARCGKVSQVMVIHE